MGGTQSKNTVNILNDIAVNAVQQTINDCVSTASQSQIISAAYVAGTVDLSGLQLTQGANININCVLTARKQSEIQSAVAQAITQYAETKGVAALSALGKSRAEAEANIKNALNIQLTNQDIQNTTAQISQDQRIQFGVIGQNFIIRGATLSQSAKIIASSIVNSEQYNRVITSIANSIDQSSTSQEENPLSFITDIFSNITGQTLAVIGAIIIIIILIIAAPIVLIAYYSGKSGGNLLSVKEKNKYGGELAEYIV